MVGMQKHYMEKINQQMVTENRKIVSIVDGFRAHKNQELLNLKQVLLDSNMTSSVQPLDLLPFAIVKSKYKSWWNNSICEEKNCDVAVCMRKIISIITNLGDDIYTSIPFKSHIQIAKKVGLKWYLGLKW